MIRCDSTRIRVGIAIHLFIYAPPGECHPVSSRVSGLTIEEAIQEVMLMERPRQFSLVLETPVASPDEASAHFLAKLSVETDISDLVFDLQKGYDGFVVLDARDEASFEACHIPGAVNVPARRVDTETTREIPKEKAVVVYCWGPGCNGATKAALALAKLGFSVKELIGGIEYWRREGGHVEGTLADAAPITGRDLSGQEKPDRLRGNTRWVRSLGLIVFPAKVALGVESLLDGGPVLVIPVGDLAAEDAEGRRDGGEPEPTRAVVVALDDLEPGVVDGEFEGCGGPEVDVVLLEVRAPEATQSLRRKAIQ